MEHFGNIAQVSGGEDRLVKLWDYEEGTRLAQLVVVFAATWVQSTRAQNACGLQSYSPNLG